LVSFDQCVVHPSLMYGFWLPLWYLQTFLVQKGRHTRTKDHNKHFRSLFFFLSKVFSVLRFTTSDCPFGIFKLFLGIMIACEIVHPATIFHIQPLNFKSIQSYLILPYLIHVQ
jgi:hypothetical protein